MSLSYRADGQPHVAYMTKSAAAADFLAGRPWRFTELLPPALEDDWDMVADDRENSLPIMAKSCGPKMSPHGSHVIFRWC